MARRPWAPIIVLATVVTIVALWRLGLKAPWTPHFDVPPLTAALVHSDNPSVIRGAVLFRDKACLYCHQVDGQGGFRGPDLTYAAGRLTREQMITRISNGGYNMPAFTYNLKPKQMGDIIAFLQSRTENPGSPSVTAAAPVSSFGAKANSH
jgi:ubiquinol-cytochrome c reductase cytochrome b subunit